MHNTGNLCNFILANLINTLSDIRIILATKEVLDSPSIDSSKINILSLASELIKPIPGLLVL